MRRFLLLPIVALLAVASPALADDKEEVRSLLDDFLANVSDSAAHERFWASELVYTSSAGTRTDKASILASFDGVEESGDPGPTYRAEDVQLQQYDDVMVVAFRLVASPPGDLPDMYYLNTGTFLKRDGEWRVVAWQATRVPPAEE